MASEKMLTHSSLIPRDFEEYVDSIDWSTLEDGYGNSSEIRKFPLSGGIAPLPILLKALCSEDEDVRQDAVNDGIWGRASHQGSVYSATPYAAKALLILLNTRSIADLPSGNGDTTAWEIFQFLSHCFKFLPNERDTSRYPYLLNAARENQDAIESYCSDPDPKVQHEAESLIKKLS